MFDYPGAAYLTMQLVLTGLRGGYEGSVVGVVVSSFESSNGSYLQLISAVSEGPSRKIIGFLSSSSRVDKVFPAVLFSESCSFRRSGVLTSSGVVSCSWPACSSRTDGTGVGS